MTLGKMPLVITLSLIAASLIIPSTAMAMRCGTRPVTDGNTQEEVLRNCGEPTQTNSRYITRGSGYVNFRTRDALSGSHQGNYFFIEEVLVEEWIFNFGPNKFMRKVTFENGIVVEIDTLRYGYHE